jgi:hypothetical protein
LFDRFIGFLQDTGFKVFDRLKAAFEDPKQAVVDLASAIKDNLIARFESIGVFGNAIAKLFKGEFKEGFTGLADASIQLSTGVENASEKISDLVNNTKDFVDVSIQQGKIVDDLIKSFERLEIDTTVPLAKLRLEFEKFRSIAQDQLQTDEDRVKALNEAIRVQEEITSIEQDLLDLTIERIELEQTFNDTSREDELELARLKADRIAFEAREQKKVNSLIAQRSSIEKRIAIENEKTSERLKEQSETYEKIETRSNAVVETNEDQLEISKDIVKQKNKELDAIAEALQKQADAEEEANQKKIDNAVATANKIADLTEKATKEAFDAEEKALEESIARREEVVAKQQKRAEQGLENQLYRS